MNSSAEIGFKNKLLRYFKKISTSSRRNVIQEPRIDEGFHQPNKEQQEKEQDFHTLQYKNERKIG
jgi:hypothetical protein